MEVARDFLPHPVDPQKRNLIRDTELSTKVASNLLIRVYSMAPGSQAFVRDETPRSCKYGTCGHSSLISSYSSECLQKKMYKNIHLYNSYSGRSKSKGDPMGSVTKIVNLTI